MAMQQGGLGLILTMLIISAPPMAASFFQGTMGQFMAYSQFGGSAGSQPGARGAGSPPTDRAVATNAKREDAPINTAPPNLTIARAENPNQTNNEMRTASETRMGTAGVQPQVAVNTTYTNPQVQAQPPSGAGGPPRGGTG
jgi:hypothetical protein